LALTDCMNFGNPEKPEIMGQFAGAIEGMREACRALDYPVVSGNVSLYNETSGSAILPTPVIGGVGLIGDVHKAVDLALKRDGDALILIGDTSGHLGASVYLREIEGSEDGAPPPVDLTEERENGDFVRALVADGLAAAVHDVSDGGLLVALAEMAMASGIGATLDPPPADLPAHAFWFGEDQARYVVTVAARAVDAVLRRAAAAAVPVDRLGKTGGEALTLPGERPILLKALRERFEGWLPGYMAGQGSVVSNQ
jgi:phosphoribosylformylglycinamidine synthase